MSLPLIAGVLLIVAIGAPAGSPEDAAAKRNRAEAQRLFREGLDALSSEAFEKAEEAFRAAVRLDPQLFLAHYGLGQTYMALRRYDDAVRGYSRCLEAYREVASFDRDRRLEVAQAREDQIQDLRDRERELQDQMRRPMTAAQRDRVQRRITNIEAGVNSLDRLRGDHMQSADPPAEFSLALGSAYFRSGKPQDAEREYLEAVRLRPRYGEAHNNLAVIYMLQDDLENAEAHLKAAEKAGFKVSPDLKKDLEQRQRGARP